MFSSLLVALWMTYGAAGALKEPLSSLRFIQEPVSTIARKNEAVTLDCQVGGFLPPKIRWTRNGQTVHQDSRKIILPSGSLYIRRILHKRDYKPDVGEYQCFASSTVGTIASRKVLLDVAGMTKKFLYEPQKITTREGSVARFSCQIQHAVPLATVTWEKNGIPLSSSERFIILDKGVLQIVSVEKADEGSYRCVARNVARTRFSQYANLTVYSARATLEPKFLGASKNTSVLKGTSVVMDCAATGYPVPMVSWRKMGEKPIVIHPGGYGVANINITNIDERDGGEYVCEASSQGQTISQSGWLFVKVGPHFTRKPSNIRRTTGHIISLSCAAKGVPVPVLSWFRNGTKLTTDGRIRVTWFEGGTDLKIVNITSGDTGMYQCFAENQVGIIQVSASVIVHSAENQPGPPTNVVALAFSSSSILISWSPPVGKYKIAAFTVHFQKLDDHNSIEMQKVVANNTHSYNVTRLQGFTKYSFYVRAYTPSSLGVPSQVVVERTLQGSPRGPPTDVKVSSSTPDSLDVTWLPPRKELQNGIITKYVITYDEQVPGGRRLPQTLEVLAHSLMTTINGLTKGKTYKITVAAATKIGHGPSSVPVEGKVLLQPINVISAPTLWISARNSSILKVDWLPPKYGHDRVAEYQLFYVQLGEGRTEKGPVILGKQDRSYSLNGLSADTQFLIKLMAWDGYKLGRPGAIRGRTERDPRSSHHPPVVNPTALPPSRPLNLVCTVESPTSLLLTWERPLSANMISFYTVKYHPRNSLNPKPLERKAHFENIILTGLSPGREYTISVQSHYVFKVGVHPRFSTTQRNCLIPESKPLLPPSNVKVDFRSVRSVEISWEKPAGIITAYEIFYTNNLSLPDARWELQDEPVGFIASRAKVLTTVLTGIKENTTLYLKIRARNKAGRGPFCDPLIVHPPSAKQRGSPNITFTTISQTIVQLSWLCPRVFDVFIISFTVLLTNDKNLPDDQWVKHTVVSLKRFPDVVSTIINVQPNRTYFIKVRAEYDDFIPGPWSKVSVVSTYANGYIKSTAGSVMQPTVEQPNSSEKSPDFNVKLGVIIGCTISAFFIVVLILFIIWRNPCRHGSPMKETEKPASNGQTTLNGYLPTKQDEIARSSRQGQRELTEETSGSSGMCQCKCTCGAGARWPLRSTIVRTNTYLPGSSDSSTPLANNSHVFTSLTRALDSEESGSHQEFHSEEDPRNTGSSLKSLSVEVHRDGHETPHCSSTKTSQTTQIC